MAKEGSPRHSLYMLVSNVWFDRIVGLIILGNVLLVWSAIHPDTGYRQGLNEVLGVILLVR